MPESGKWVSVAVPVYIVLLKACADVSLLMDKVTRPAKIIIMPIEVRMVKASLKSNIPRHDAVSGSTSESVYAVERGTEPIPMAKRV